MKGHVMGCDVSPSLGAKSRYSSWSWWHPWSGGHWHPKTQRETYYTRYNLEICHFENHLYKVNMGMAWVAPPNMLLKTTLRILKSAFFVFKFCSSSYIASEPSHPWMLPTTVSPAEGSRSMGSFLKISLHTAHSFLWRNQATKKTGLWLRTH